jgi:hypothetical protein
VLILIPKISNSKLVAILPQMTSDSAASTSAPRLSGRSKAVPANQPPATSTILSKTDAPVSNHEDGPPSKKRKTTSAPEPTKELLVTSFQVIYPADPTYESARFNRIFNLRRPSRFPSAIAYPLCAADVSSCVALAIKNDWKVSVRSGGHSWAAWSVRDGAILLDLGLMREMVLDEKTNVVGASPAITGRELNAFLEGKGRMFPGAHAPDVGLGGFLLQGGMGWNAKGWGWACEYLVGADVVTATGASVHCSVDENADLFWAVRGSGPGCPAIVTRFYLNTRLAYSAMYSSTYVYPVSEYKTVMDWVVKVSPSFDQDTEIVCVSASPPSNSDAPSSTIEHNIIALFTTFKNALVEATEALSPAELSHPPGAIVSLFCKPTSFDAEYMSQSAAAPKGYRYVVDNAYLRNDCDVTTTLEDAFTKLPTEKSYALYFSMAPTSRRKLPDMALSLQSDHYCAFYCIWKDDKDDILCQNWLKDRFGAMEKEKQSVGSYLGDADFQVRQSRFWEEEQGKKLMTVRRKWDLEGRICGYLGGLFDEGREDLPNLLEKDLA